MLCGMSVYYSLEVFSQYCAKGSSIVLPLPYHGRVVFCSFENLFRAELGLLVKD